MLGQKNHKRFLTVWGLYFYIEIIDKIGQRVEEQAMNEDYAYHTWEKTTEHILVLGRSY